ncbi:hypothetical protein ACL02U_01135 [Streptomyces sp. MS06]|uniref:hypothetical protein n=1 Tax=Streptomyces sp. MS06 TaxID=3385974 RepID=UPI0039A389A7
MSARFNRRRSRFLVSAAAAAVLGSAVPLFAGAPAAWAACGGGDTTASAPATAQHEGDPEISFLPGTPSSLTAGGAPVELSVEMANFTGAAYEDLRPVLGFDNLESGSGAGGPTNLRPEDFTVQVMTGGQWKTLPVHHSCDPVINPDTSVLAQHLDSGHAARFLFRVALSDKAPADQRDIVVFLGTEPSGTVRRHTLHIVRLPAESTAPAQTPDETAPPQTDPTPAAGRTAAQAAATTGTADAPASPTALPSTAASAVPQLASTGSGDSSGLLLGAGFALVVVGAGAVTVVARRP